MSALPQSNRWNVLKVAGIGAIVGVVYSVAKRMIEAPGTPADYYLGLGVGGAIGGAVLFGMVAVVRNLFARK